MPDIAKMFALLATVFCLLTLIYNIMPRKLPRFPWDVYINQPFLRAYIPVISSLIVSAAITLFFNFFKK